MRSPRSKTRTNKGKRRVVSPARSDSSNNTIGKSFVERTKRIKSEPAEPFPDPSTPAVGNDIDHTVWPTPTEEFEARDAARSGFQPSPARERVGQQSRAGFTGYLGFVEPLEPPADLLAILASRDTGTKRFQGRVEEVVEDAFKVAPRSETDAPGLLYIERIIESLDMSGATTQRTDEVRQRLMEVWRLQMAGYLGTNIACSDELRETVNAIVSALPFRSRHSGFLLGSTANIQPQTSATGIRQDDNQIDAGNTQSNGRRECSGTHCSGCSAQNDVIASQFDTPPSSATAHTRRENDFDNSDSEKKDRKTIKLRFADAQDVFCYHLERYCRGVTQERQRNFDDGQLFRQRAEAIFGTLDGKQRKAWHRLHRQVRGGDIDGLDETASQKLLAEQGILTALVICSSLGKPSEPSAASSMGPRPVMIPFISRDGCDTSRSVMLVVNTPDTPIMNATDSRLVRAFVAGSAPQPSKVESWSEHISVATFQTIETAERAKGKAIDLNGRGVIIEHLYRKPPPTFSCDFTDIDVSEDEVARQTAHAFAGCDGKPKLEVQEVWKLYAGRQFLITLPKSQRLVRFYIPVRVNNSEEVFMACFRPVNVTLPCSFCRDRHRVGSCEHSREVRLPPVG